MYVCIERVYKLRYIIATYICPRIGVNPITHGILNLDRYFTQMSKELQSCFAPYLYDIVFEYDKV